MCIQFVHNTIASCFMVASCKHTTNMEHPSFDGLNSYKPGLIGHVPHFRDDVPNYKPRFLGDSMDIRNDFPNAKPHVPSSSKDFQQFPMIFHGFPMNFPWISHQFPWMSIHFARESHGFPQCSPFRPAVSAFSAAALAASARGGRAPVRSVAKVAPAMEALRRENDPPKSHGILIQWVGLRENLQETMFFTIKYGVFL